MKFVKGHTDKHNIVTIFIVRILKKARSLAIGSALEEYYCPTFQFLRTDISVRNVICLRGVTIAHFTPSSVKNISLHPMVAALEGFPLYTICRTVI